MTKLDGNERWKSKMLLTEHQEQYERRRAPKHAGRATAEEIHMIRDAIMLPHMLTISQRAHDDVMRSGNPFKHHYAAMTQIVMDLIAKELYRIKRELRDRKIKIEADEAQDGIIYHRYWCRGYEDRFGIVRETLASEIRKRLGKYGKEMIDRLKEEGRAGP